MVFNTESFRFNTLIIDGTLRIDDSIEHTTIYANNIWIRGGKIVAGKEDVISRFTKKLDIILTGNKNSSPLIVDELSKPGTKSMVVTGKLELYGVYPVVT
jgi:hypothetical protein